FGLAEIIQSLQAAASIKFYAETFRFHSSLAALEVPLRWAVRAVIALGWALWFSVLFSPAPRRAREPFAGPAKTPAPAGGDPIWFGPAEIIQSLQAAASIQFYAETFRFHSSLAALEVPLRWAVRAVIALGWALWFSVLFSPAPRRTREPFAGPAKTPAPAGGN